MSLREDKLGRRALRSRCDAAHRVIDLVRDRMTASEPSDGRWDLSLHAQQTKAHPRARECAMSPTKQRFVGLAGCLLVVGGSTYRLRDGKSTRQLAITLSLLLAEPSLRRHKHKQCVAISCEAAASLGYQVARTYDDAAIFGLA
jgi:hypothetical protein